jgi:hypothetical protein
MMFVRIELLTPLLRRGEKSPFMIDVYSRRSRLAAWGGENRIYRSQSRRDMGEAARWEEERRGQGAEEEESVEKRARVVKDSGWGRSGNEIRNVESRRERSGESHGGSGQKPKLNTREPR